MIKLFETWNHKLNVLFGSDTYNINEYLGDDNAI